MTQAVEAVRVFLRGKPRTTDEVAAAVAVDRDARRNRRRIVGVLARMRIQGVVTKAGDLWSLTAKGVAGA